MKICQNLRVLLIYRIKLNFNLKSLNFWGEILLSPFKAQVVTSFLSVFGLFRTFLIIYVSLKCHLKSMWHFTCTIPIFSFLIAFVFSGPLYVNFPFSLCHILVLSLCFKFSEPSMLSLCPPIHSFPRHSLLLMSAVHVARQNQRRCSGCFVPKIKKLPDVSFSLEKGKVHKLGHGIFKLLRDYFVTEILLESMRKLWIFKFKFERNCAIFLKSFWTF